MALRTPCTTSTWLLAQMVDFGGWDMPINYGSQLERTPSGTSRRRHV